MRRIALLTSCVLVLGGFQPAQAHQPSDYPYNWTYSITSRVFYYKHTYPTGNWRDRFEDAMQRWNNVSGASLTFSAGGTATDGDDACGNRDIINRQDIPSGAPMRTVICDTFNSTVKISVDDTIAFDAGAATPNDPNKYDLQGGLEHELGHASRGWLLCVSPDDPDDADPCRGRHYDSTYNGLICDGSDLPSYSTMCSNYPPLAQTWRFRSLETHDEDIFATAY